MTNLRKWKKLTHTPRFPTSTPKAIDFLKVLSNNSSLACWFRRRSRSPSRFRRSKLHSRFKKVDLSQVYKSHGTETKRKCPSFAKRCAAFFPTWSLTQLPTHFLEFYWFRMLSWIRNFLTTNGKGYDNSRLSDDIHRGSRQIHDKWLRFTCRSCTSSQNGLAMKTFVKPL